MTKILTIHFALMLLTVFMWCGCSHTRLITVEDVPSGVDTINTAAANRLLSDQTVVLVLPSGREQTVSGVVLTKDSCSFLAEGKTVRSSLPMREVRALQDKDYIWGAIVGGTVGFASGFALGYAGYRLSTPDASGGTSDDLAILWYGNPWVNWGASLGGLIGLGIGASNGIGTEYQILYPRAAADSLLQSARSNE